MVELRSVLLSLVLLASIAVVDCTHFRYGVIYWRRVVANNTESIFDSYTFRFRVVSGWDVDFFEQPFLTFAATLPPANTPFPYLLITGGGFFFGDNTSMPWDGDHCVSLRKPARGFIFAHCIYFHTYEEAIYPWTEAYFLSCCRIEFIDGLRNNQNLQTRVWVTVIFDDVFVDSPITGFLPISTVPLQRGDSIAYQQFVAFDPLGYDIIYLHADTEQMSGFAANTTGVPNSFPPTGWTIGLHTGMVAWYGADTLIHWDLWNAQILVQHPFSNRSIAVDFLYRIQIVDKMCLGPAQDGCSDTQYTLCSHADNCTKWPACYANCTFPEIPEFIDPTPPLGSLIVVYALQTNTFPIVANRTGSHCCEPGEYLWYEEGPMPLGFGDPDLGLLEDFGTNPYTAMYTWTPTIDQAGLHQVCWGACAANDILPGFIEVCSAPHCFGIFVSLKPNLPPVNHVPDEHWTEFGIIAYHDTWKYFYDLYTTDDSGDHDIETHITADRGVWEVGAWPEGLEFINGTNGTMTPHFEMFGSLFQINFALYKSHYKGNEGFTVCSIYTNDHGWEGMGQGEGWTSLTDYDEFLIHVLPACINPCGTNLEIMTIFYEDLKGEDWIQNDNWLVGDPCWDHWHGVYCEAGEIVTINLPENKLNGTLPCELGCLHYLRNLWVMNNYIYGLIPPKFGEMTCLEHFGVAYNQLDWTIPSELSAWKELKYMQLNNNRLIGTVPAGFAELTNMKELLLQNNLLTGTLPEALWTNLDLNYFWVDDNSLDQPVPDSWSIERFYDEDELERIGRLNNW